MDFADHNSPFIDAFGESVVFTPAGGGAEVVTVVVSDSQSLSDAAPGTQMLVSGSLESSGLSRAPAKGDVFTVGGEVYRCFSVHIDQYGWFKASVTK